MRVRAEVVTGLHPSPHGKVTTQRTNKINCSEQVNSYDSLQCKVSQVRGFLFIALTLVLGHAFGFEDSQAGEDVIQ